MSDWRTLLSVLAIHFTVKACAHNADTFAFKCADGTYATFKASNHIFEVDSRGRVLDETRRSDGGTGKNFAPEFKKIASALEKYHDCRKQSESPTHVLLFFHGGLNSSKTAWKRAEAQVLPMLKDGYFPIFGVWDTGLLKTYGEQIAHVRNGHYANYDFNFRQPQSIDDSIFNGTLTVAYVVSDVLSGLARAPTTYQHQTGRWWNSRALSAHKLSYLMSEDECFRLPGTTTSASSSKINCRQKDNLKKPWQKNLIMSESVDRPPSHLRAESYSYALATPLRFLTVASADSIGTTAWENMVRRTRTGVHRPVEFNAHIPEGALWYVPKKWVLADQTERNKKHEFVEEQLVLFPKGIGGFSKFFSMLEACFAAEELVDPTAQAPRSGPQKCDENIIGKSERSALRNIDLTLIGHSMGTIILNEIVPLFPELPYRNIVYMAAAASIRDTKRAIAPLLEKSNGRVKFYGLMLHPQNDAREIALYGALPSGSLLSWVDEMYEDPRTMQDRTFGSWRNLRTTKHLFGKEAQHHMRFRVFDWHPYTEKAKCGKDFKIPAPYPSTHGGFSDCRMRYWCPEFWAANASDDTWREKQDALWPGSRFDVCGERPDETSVQARPAPTPDRTAAAR